MRQKITKGWWLRSRRCQTLSKCSPTAEDCLLAQLVKDTTMMARVRARCLCPQPRPPHLDALDLGCGQCGYGRLLRGLGTLFWCQNAVGTFCREQCRMQMIFFVLLKTEPIPAALKRCQRY